MANRPLSLIIALLMLCSLSAQVEMARPYSPTNTIFFFDLHDVILKPDIPKRMKIALNNPLQGLKLGIRAQTNKNWRNGEQLQIELRQKGDKKLAKVVRQFSAAYKVDIEVFQILKQLKSKGYTICMASNIGAHNLDDLLDESHPRNKIKSAECVTLRDVFALFDDLIFVDYENDDVVSKPDPRYFTLLHDRRGLAEHIMFIDDNKKNIAAAHACGIHGIRFTSAEKLSHDLKTLGIL